MRNTLDKLQHLKQESSNVLQALGIEFDSSSIEGSIPTLLEFEQDGFGKKVFLKNSSGKTTSGKISCRSTNIQVAKDGNTIPFSSAIKVKSTTDTPFSVKEDSGKIAYTEDGMAIGIVISDNDNASFLIPTSAFKTLPDIGLALGKKFDLARFNEKTILQDRPQGYYYVHKNGAPNTYNILRLGQHYEATKIQENLYAGMHKIHSFVESEDRSQQGLQVAYSSQEQGCRTLFSQPSDIGSSIMARGDISQKYNASNEIVVGVLADVINEYNPTDSRWQQTAVVYPAKDII